MGLWGYLSIVGKEQSEDSPVEAEVDAAVSAVEVLRDGPVFSEVVVTTEGARKELEAVDGVEQQRGRKRKREPDSWQRNQHKRLRNAGLSYVSRNKKSVPGRAVKPKDYMTCRYKCNTKVGEPEAGYF